MELPVLKTIPWSKVKTFQFDKVDGGIKDTVVMDDGG
jgi:hypothetical protein